MIRVAVTLAALLGLFGCGAVERPAPVACFGAEAAALRDPGGGVAGAVVAAATGAEAGLRAGGERAGAAREFLALTTGGPVRRVRRGVPGRLDRRMRAEPRPDFDIVTGVSAGALLAVPAALGRDYDGLLTRFRGLSNDDVLERRGLGALFGPSLYGVGGLERALRDETRRGCRGGACRVRPGRSSSARWGWRTAGSAASI